MDMEADADREERLRNAVEQLTRIQRSVLELNREAQRIRMYIRDFDVNVEALNILARVRSRDEKGGGVQALEDVIRYARLTGVHFKVFENTVTPGMLEHSIQTETEKYIECTEERKSVGLLKLVTQLAAAVAVTSGLFVLIH